MYPTDDTISTEADKNIDEEKEIILPTSVSQGGKKNNQKQQLNQKHIHKISKTTNQISYYSFNNFVGEFFKELSEKKYEEIFFESVIDEDIAFNKLFEESYTCEVKREISLKNRLFSAFITDDSKNDTIYTENDFLKSLNLDFTNTDDLDNLIVELFIQNKIPIYDETEFALNGNEIAKLIVNLKKQVIINNKRKKIFKQILQKRMLFMSFLQALKIIDSKLQKLYLKRNKAKVKSRSNEEYEEIKTLLDIRKHFFELFQDELNYENILFTIDNLFTDHNEQNIKLKDYNPDNYFLED
ncbi:hypothetical protein CWI38_0514p0020 [Hamiltosporidium tvaerminnensis]|uniref:Uncharacterized protein n=1 Tax=Hamiltosporidium tvaerminnensis TaxID=1176355 RepID=A0A4Q9LXX2_9MICR|nr:hypothetical protein CWI38_0514p0020 [Hamiltosporidium tvaerminnensis]